MMKMESILKMSGVQSILMQLLQAAAPELTEQVGEIAKVAFDCKAQFDRIERQQLAIMAHLGISPGEHDAGKDLGGLNRGPAIASNGAGKQTAE